MCKIILLAIIIFNAIMGSRAIAAENSNMPGNVSQIIEMSKNGDDFRLVTMKVIDDIRKLYVNLPPEQMYLPFLLSSGEDMEAILLFVNTGNDEPLRLWLNLAGMLPKNFRASVQVIRKQYPKETFALERDMLKRLVDDGRSGISIHALWPAHDTTEYLSGMADSYKGTPVNADLDNFIEKYPFLFWSHAWQQRFTPGVDDPKKMKRNISSEREYLADYFVRLIKNTNREKPFHELVRKFQSEEIARELSDPDFAIADIGAIKTTSELLENSREHLIRLGIDGETTEEIKSNFLKKYGAAAAYPLHDVDAAEKKEREP